MRYILILLTLTSLLMAEQETPGNKFFRLQRVCMLPASTAETGSTVRVTIHGYPNTGLTFTNYDIQDMFDETGIKVIDVPRGSWLELNFNGKQHVTFVSATKAEVCYIQWAIFKCDKDMDIHATYKITTFRDVP